MNKNNVADLTSKLIAIPSYVEGDVNEAQIGKFVFDYLNQFNWLKVTKQFVSKDRFNVIATDKYPTEIILCGHLDTVQIKTGWKTKPLQPTVKKGNLYGLGASDMKSSIAAMISQLDQIKATKGLMLFFYVDEEYDFLGMKKFIQEYKKKISPKLVVSGDGCGLELGNGCRGLIEITFQVAGVTAHAGRPELGKNAILISSKVINDLNSLFESEFQNPILGKSTCNLAYLQGGLNLSNSRKQLVIGREGNNIADIAEFVVDIRPADTKLNAKKVIELISSLVKKQGGKVIDFTIRHDFGAWSTSKNDLKSIDKAMLSVTKVTYSPLGSFGYIDTQLLWQAFNKVPCVTIGAGAIGTAHKANEYVPLADLKQLSDIFRALLKKMEVSNA